VSIVKLYPRPQARSRSPPRMVGRVTRAGLAQREQERGTRSRPATARECDRPGLTRPASSDGGAFSASTPGLR